MTTSSSAASLIYCAALSPTDSGQNLTVSPKASCRASATGFKVNSILTLPLGRPKWLRTTTRAPLLESSVRVGTTRSMRLVSVILPSIMGTFKSTRTSTLLPSTSRSSMVLNFAIFFALPPLRRFLSKDIQETT